MKILLFTFFFFCISLACAAQQSQSDTLTRTDSVKVVALEDTANPFYDAEQAPIIRRKEQDRLAKDGAFAVLEKRVDLGIKIYVVVVGVLTVIALIRRGF